MKCPACRAENPPTSRFCADCGTSLTPVSGPEDDSDTKTLPPFYDLETGTLFADRYRIIEKIGVGGMGIIYKAYDTKIQEKIALKLIRPEISVDQRNVELFRNEVRAARRISHKNICRMYDLGEFAQTIFFTMELVPGENLKSILQMTSPLSFKTAVHYARQVCEGLMEAHKKLIHRDLKPQNVMVDSTGTVRIMDFGIARQVLASGGTSPNLPIGTPEYMSPEQATGTGVDPRTDIYSLGVVLYEMVTGKVPFEGETALEILRKHEFEAPRPPKDVNPQVPEDLDRLIMKCLEKSREKRYRDAAELGLELGKVETKLIETPGTWPATKPGTIPDGEISDQEKKPGIRDWRKSALRYGLAFAAIVVTAFVAVRIIIPAINGGRAKPAPLSKIPRIAVLPLDIRGTDPNHGLIGEQLAMTIMEALRIAGLDVLAPDASKRIKEAEDRPEILRRTRTDQYIEGSAHIENGRMTVLVYLTAAPESYIWSHKYEDRIEMITDVANLISVDLAREFKKPLSETQITALRKRSPSGLESTLAFNKGIQARKKYDQSWKEEDFLEARDYFRKVSELEPGFSLAYLEMGVLYEGRWVQTEDPADLEEMARNFEEAFARDPSVACIRAGLGWIHFHRQQYEKAYDRFKEALQLDPNDDIANGWAASFLRSIGLDGPAIRHYNRAIDHNPLEAMSYRLCGASYYYLGDYDMALQRLDEVLQIDPGNANALFDSARVLTALGRLDEAEQKLESLEELAPENPNYRWGITIRRALILALRGKREEALGMIEGEERPYRFEITNLHAVLGMKDEAIKNIRYGNEHGFELIKDYLYTYPYLTTNPLFRNLRGDPRFEEVVRKEKEKFEEKMRKFGDL
jgi:serine/threonine protein kinase/tetratricopeptide (TPR) repeat protein